MLHIHHSVALSQPSPCPIPRVRFPIHPLLHCPKPNNRSEIIHDIFDIPMLVFVCIVCDTQLNMGICTYDVHDVDA
jgi:hypothetical protein